MSADEIIGHNILKFDIPVIQKLYPWFQPAGKVTDTLVLSRLIHSDVKREDGEAIATGKLTKDGFRVFDGKKHKSCFGSHSLAAWGMRIGVHKGDYTGGWDNWSSEMQHYCEQDVETTEALWRYLKPWDYSETSIRLEHRIAALCFKMEQNGVPFDMKAAIELHAELITKREKVKQGLVDLFPPWEEVDRVFVPKVNNKTRGYVKGQEVTVMKTVVFNPGSRQHIAKCLMDKYGWKPEKFTETGQVEINEEILTKLKYPEAQQLAEYFMLDKRLGQLSEGDQNWIDHCKDDGRMYPTYNPGGTVSGRASHAYPNIGQVPNTHSPYGKECRQLFTVPDGWALVGTDMAGLELRCLSHYMHQFDQGAYAEIVTSGDVHTANQQAAGLPTRDNAKTFIYGFLYGAGPEKIGKIVNAGKARGKELIDTFLKNLPALSRLRSAVSAGSQRGYLIGLDGRRLSVRSAHAALNVLLQGAGAILCKEWGCLIDENLQLNGLKHGWDGDYVFLMWVHDEYQIACRKGLEATIVNTAKQMAPEAGRAFGFKCPLKADAKVGQNWAETH